LYLGASAGKKAPHELKFIKLRHRVTSKRGATFAQKMMERL
jgi:hypothetical protein